MDRLRSEFDIDKTVQAAAVLLREAPDQSVELIRLMKLMYLADRASVQGCGRAITGDRYVAMDNGPVLSELYDTMKDQSIHSDVWRRFFQRRQFVITLANDPGVGRLSPFEVQTLQEQARAFEHIDTWDLVERTHTLAEWVKNKPAKRSSRSIPIEDIFEAVGIPPFEREQIIAELRIQQSIRRRA